MLKRTKATLGSIGRRFGTETSTRSGRDGPGDEGMRTPEDVVDVGEWSAPDQLGLGERLSRKKRVLATFGVLGTIGLGLLLVYARQFAVGFVTALPTQVGALVVAAGTVAYLSGLKNGRAEVSSSGWLVAKVPGGVLCYLGEHTVAPDGTEVFVPYLGFDPISGKSRPLKVDELGGHVDQTRQKKGREEARIRLDDASFDVRETAYGTVIGAITDGLAPDPFGQHSDVYLSPPSEVEAEAVNELRSAYETMRDEVRRLEDRNDAANREIAELVDELKRSRGEYLDDFSTRVGKLAEVINGRKRRPRATAGDGDETRDREAPEDDGMSLEEAKQVVGRGDVTLDEAGVDDRSGGGSA